MAYWHDCWQQNNVASIGDDGKSVICFSFSLSIRYLSVYLSLSRSNFLPAIPSAVLAFFFFFFLSLSKAFVYPSYFMIVSVCLFIRFCFHLPRPASEPRKIVVVSSCNELDSLTSYIHDSSQPINWKRSFNDWYAPPFISVCWFRIINKCNITVHIVYISLFFSLLPSFHSVFLLTFSLCPCVMNSSW